MPDIFDQLSSGSSYKATGDVFDTLPDAEPASSAPPQPASLPVPTVMQPAPPGLPQPHEAVAQAELNARQFVDKLESVGHQMMRSSIPPALRTPEPTIQAAPHPFLSRLREAVTGPDSALGATDENKTTKPLVNFQDLLPPSSGPVTSAIHGVAEGVSGFTTPANLATIPLIGTFGKIGGPVVSRLIAGGFSLQGLKGLWDTSQEFKQAVSSGNTDDAWRLAGRGVADAGMTAWMARDAIRGEGASSEQKPSPDTAASPSSGDIFDRLPAGQPRNVPTAENFTQDQQLTSAPSNAGAKAEVSGPDVFDRLQNTQPAKPGGDIFAKLQDSSAPSAPAGTASTSSPSDTQDVAGALGPEATRLSGSAGIQARTEQPPDLANFSTGRDAPVENTQPLQQLPAPETAAEQAPTRAAAETDQPGGPSAGDQRSAPVLGPKPDDNRPPSSVQLNSMLGGLEEPLKQFGKDDVIPRLKDAADAVASAKDDIQKTFAPSTRDFSSSRASAILRNRIAESVRSYDAARTALAKAKRFFDSQSAADSYGFIDRIENGNPQPTPELQDMADTFRQMLDDRRKQIQALGTGKLDSFLTGYFPHIWERPGEASELFTQMLARRPLEGSKGFLKKRSYITFKDGLDAGLKPVSDNPVTLALLKTREMDKYLLAHRTLADLKDEGLAEFVRLGGAAPPGWKRIGDPIGTKYSTDDNGGMVLRGHYYVPEGASSIINNYLSPGLRSKGWFRGAIGLENSLNQAQLGISAYHIGATTLNSGISRVALGLEQAMRGRPVTGLKNIASAPVAPIQNLLEGSKLLREWMKPGSEGGEFGAIANEMMKAGGRARNDSFFQQRMVDSMVTAWKHGNPIGALARLPVAALEEVAKPVMEWWVPRLKAGMFLDFARSEMEFHNRRMQSGMAESRSYEEMSHSMRDAWNSVDARLGSVVHDNWFWNRMLKDVAMLNVRSLGWNAGTVMELGGGAVDLVKQPLNAVQGKHVNLKRLSYLIALNTVMPMINAVYQYARTGQTPQDWKDYLAPRNGDTDENGNPQRTYFPTYMRDEYAWMHDPGTTLVNKLSPLDNLTGELIRNRDYYGNSIVNADDGWQDKATELARFAGKEALPFGIRNAMEQSKQGAPLSNKLQSFVGITPAPRSINQTKAERLASQLVQQRIPQGGRTQEQADRSDLERQITRDLKLHKDVRSEAVQALRDGKISAKELVQTIKDSKLTPLERSVEHLDANDLLKVYNVATPDEQRMLRVPLIKKLYNAEKTMPEIYFAPLAARVKAALRGKGQT